MNLTDILLSALSIILTGLATWGLTVFTTYMNDKLKEKRSQKYANAALEIVTKCVKATYQTYVESIKDTDLWTKEAQEKALQMSLDAAKSQLNNDIKEYITTNYTSVDEFLVNLIEAVLYDLKN